MVRTKQAAKRSANVSKKHEETVAQQRMDSHDSPAEIDRGSAPVDDSSVSGLGYQGTKNVSQAFNQTSNNKKSLGTEKNVTKKRKFRPGTRALMDVRKYQNTTKPLIPKLPFSRVVREIAAEFDYREYRFHTLAMYALQEAAEAFLVDLFERMQLAAIHTGRVTVRPRDLHLVRRYRGRRDGL